MQKHQSSIIHAKYESSTSYGAKVMANVKVFADGQTDGQTDRVITIGHPPMRGPNE